MWRLLLLSLLGLTLGYMSNREQRVFDKGGSDFKPHMASQKAVEGELWGIVDVRPLTHLFYWLYYTTHADGYLNRPIVLWLQGGPGGSSTGFGNFDIIGPLDRSLEPRNATWVQAASILFVDTPVGAGYSWCDQDQCFTRDGYEIADDMYEFLQVFLSENPEFRTSEFYIVGESYGGKMAATICRRLFNEISAGNLEMNLVGFGMGNSWISPMDSVNTWGDLLYWMSTLDEDGQKAVNDAAQLTQNAVDAEDWFLATDLWAYTEQVLWQHSNYVDFYHILRFVIFGEYERQHYRNTTFGNKYDFHLGPMAEMSLYELMNGPIREKLEIMPAHVTWDGQSGDCFFYQEGDFMKDVLDDISWILENTNMKVIVYQGQLDLICDTKGALQWVQKLTWSGLPNYNAANRKFAVEPRDGQTDLFIKAYQNFKFYWNLRAGHMVPADMPDASLRMLNRILDNVDF